MKRPWLQILALVILIPVGARAFVAYRQHRAVSELMQCRGNLRSIGTACEMYSTDFKGRYPVRMSQLVPRYLKCVPTCPEAGADTYSAGFRSASNPDAYTFYCSGQHGIGQPPYNSTYCPLF
jgi:hypothetical protein